MLADDIGVNVAGVDAKVRAQGVLKTSGVEHGAGTDNAALGQTAHLDGGIGENVDGVGDDEQDALEADLANLRNNRLKNVDVLVHQVQTGLAGLLGGTGGDYDDGGVSSVLIVARIDLHGAGEGGAVADIEGFALGAIAIDVDEHHLAEQTALHQRERGGRTNETATDDSDFPVINHGRFLPFKQKLRQA